MFNTCVIINKNSLNCTVKWKIDYKNQVYCLVGINELIFSLYSTHYE